MAGGGQGGGSKEAGDVHDIKAILLPAEVERRVGAQAGTGTRVTLLRPAGRDGLAPTRLRRPGPGGVCRHALPVGSCGARVLYRSG